jgi:hypothetical protein
VRPPRIAQALALPLAAALCLWLAPAASAAPQVGAAWSSAVTASSAHLHAEINPQGTTPYHFTYIAQAAYEENLAGGQEGFAGAAKAPSGIDPTISGATVQSPQQSLVALKPETTYRYRPVAGAVTGAEHTFTTEGLAGASALLDARGWELVSPVAKNGGQVEGPGQSFGGGVAQAAAGGEAATYGSNTSFDGSAQGAPAASQYISRRGEGGWASEDITAPLLSGGYGDQPNGVPYQLFSADLAHGLLLSGVHCRDTGSGCPVPNPPLAGSGAPAGYQNYYLRDDEDGGYQALVGAGALGFSSLSSAQFSLAFAGSDPGLAHPVLSSCAALTADAIEVPGPEGCVAAESNLYQWSGGELVLVNRLAGQSKGTPGARLAAQAGAISADGQRVYFSELEDGAIYLGQAGAAAKLVPETVGGGAVFQTASADGSEAFFTKGATLYRYSVAAETSEALATEVKGVLGASPDGAYLYYETATGLFAYHQGTASKIAAEGAESNYPPSSGTARVSADGTHLAFLSAAALTGYDNTDNSSPAPCGGESEAGQAGICDSELYLYDAAAKELLCASCNPTGERPLGPSSIPGAIANGKAPGATDAYKPRALSADGRRLFFDSEDSLALQDTNNRPDAYEWEAQGTGSCQRLGGCIGLISSGRDPEASEFIDASESGADAFFLTNASLVPADPGSVDLYDARQGGGFPVPPAPLPCEGDACQSLPPEPEDPQPATLQANPGNPAPHWHKLGAKGHPHEKHHRKTHTHRHGAKKRGGGR